MMEAIKNFFRKIVFTIRTIAFLFAIWAVIFATNKVLNTSFLFEYDEGLVYSGDAIKKALKECNCEYNSREFYEKLNLMCQRERKKIIPNMILNLSMIFGISSDALVNRIETDKNCIYDKWKGKINNFYFISDLNQIYQMLEKNDYALFFAVSDDNIIQAIKSKTRVIRIRKNHKSPLQITYNPKKFKERVLWLSEF